VLQTTGRSVEAWADGKSKKSTLGLSRDGAALVLVAGSDNKQLPLGGIGGVGVGAPPGTKKKLFGKTAKQERSVVLVDAAGALLLHLELESEEGRNALAAALGALTGLAPQAMAVA
jgi:hypothetical protein